MVTQLKSPQKPDVIYPDSDGKPMANNTDQFRWILVIEQNLEWMYANDQEKWDTSPVLLGRLFLIPNILLQDF
ncbi:hypothetical protein [Oscillatoria nigro-viridis]|uniref:hypothetical protein n=1 Tax=Phormidium nigroviride TaxID=482564 RepID=UPI0003179A91|nr:hypothetical protein [Oscillatoria nigro-viridis]